MSQSFGRRVGGPSANPVFASAAPTRPSLARPVNRGGQRSLSFVDAGATPVLWLRWVSAMVDIVILGVVILAIMYLSIVVFDIADAKSGTPAHLVFLSALVAFSYGVIMDWKCGGTIGKHVTKTRVTDADGLPLSFTHSLGRNAGKVLSGNVPFFLAYSMVFFTTKRQSLHDWIAKTFVYRLEDLQNVAATFD